VFGRSMNTNNIMTIGDDKNVADGDDKTMESFFRIFLDLELQLNSLD